MRSESLSQLDGVLVLNKPKGPSSNSCLMKVKRLGQRKIGHAGTLDPMAKGVLLVLLGQATKISSHLMQAGEKIYEGVLELGLTSDTYDSEGTLLEKRSYENIAASRIYEEVASWIRLHEQEVPPYSAAKEKGEPLYKLARRGTIVHRVKSVQIAEAEVLALSIPYVRFRVKCSTGTYIRSLAHSLGMRLGCGAILTDLTRTYSHPFGIESAIDLESILSDPSLLETSIRPIRQALPHWSVCEIGKSWISAVKNGQALPLEAISSAGEKKQCILLYENRELALCELDENGSKWNVVRGLWKDTKN